MIAMTEEQFLNARETERLKEENLEWSPAMKMTPEEEEEFLVREALADKILAIVLADEKVKSYTMYGALTIVREYIDHVAESEGEQGRTQ